MKYLLMTLTVLISFNCFSQDKLEVDLSKVESFETSARELIRVSDLNSKKLNGVSIQGQTLIISKPSLIQNLELKDGQVINLPSKDDMNSILSGHGGLFRITMSGGQDGGGG